MNPLAIFILEVKYFTTKITKIKAKNLVMKTDQKMLFGRTNQY